MTQFLELMVQGVLLGATYGLLALPMSLAFSTVHSIDAAVGSYAVLAAAIVASLGGIVGIVTGVAAASAMGIVTGLLVVYMSRRGPADPLSIVLMSFGMAFFLQGVVLAWQGRDAIVHHASTAYWDLGGVSVNPRLVTNGVLALAVMALLAWVLRRTMLGRSLRASADNPHAAQLTGLPVRWLQASALMMGGTMAGLAGVLLFYSSGVTYTSGLHLTLVAIAVAVLFRLSGPGYCLIGGVVFGIAEVMVGGYTSGGLTAALPYALIFLILAASRTVAQGARP